MIQRTREIYIWVRACINITLLLFDKINALTDCTGDLFSVLLHNPKEIKDS